MSVPCFDPGSCIHKGLAELSEQAHEAAQRGDEAALQRIEAEIDEQAAKLWGLSEAELHDIQTSLRELEGDKGEEIQ